METAKAADKTALRYRHAKTKAPNSTSTTLFHQTRPAPSSKRAFSTSSTVEFTGWLTVSEATLADDLVE
jgi:hypothetical protein